MYCAAFASQSDHLLLDVDVLGANCQGSRCATGGFEVQPKEDGVELGIGARGGCDVNDAGELFERDCSAWAWKSPRFGDVHGGMVGGDESFVCGEAIEIAQGTDHVLGSRASLPGGPSVNGTHPSLFHEGLQLASRRLVDGDIRPFLLDACPVGAIGPE